MSSTGKRLIGLMVLLSACAILFLRPGGNKALIAEDADTISQASISSSPLLSALKNEQDNSEQIMDTVSVEPVGAVETVPQRQSRTVRASWPKTRKIQMLVTAYCPCRKCCGKFSDGKTASGKSIYTNSSMFVAADTSILPFGAMVSIPGYHGGLPVPVLDRGRAIKNHRIDLFFLSHEQAKRWGAKRLEVTVYLPEE